MYGFISSHKEKARGDKDADQKFDKIEETAEENEDSLFKISKVVRG